MSKYVQLCSAMDRVGGYMSDAIGKCQRDLRRAPNGRSRIDLYLSESDTFRAFERGEKLHVRFNASRSVPGFLIWDEPTDVKKRIVPMPVNVDWESGVLQQRKDHAYGLISDVAHCLKRKDASRNWAPLSRPGAC